jgi:uncharacterized protein YdeI (YjbR/CyaY-like superfamily)
MSSRKTNPQVDAYLNKAKKWQEESKKLRKILLDCSLTEEFKWNKPCYMFEKHNVIVMLPLKEYCALMFCKGALLKDPKKILFRPSENTQAMRQLRFANLQEIVAMENVLKAYILEAIAVEKAGLEVTYKKITDYAIPEELQSRLKKNPALKTAFNALTPGRQRAYLLHFSAPKQSKTRESRIEKCIPQILKGKGLNDDYKLSK